MEKFLKVPVVPERSPQEDPRFVFRDTAKEGNSQLGISNTPDLGLLEGRRLSVIPQLFVQ